MSTEGHMDPVAFIRDTLGSEPPLLPWQTRLLEGVPSVEEFHKMRYQRRGREKEASMIEVTAAAILAGETVKIACTSEAESKRLLKAACDLADRMRHSLAHSEGS